MKVSHLVLSVALLAALGSWMAALGEWSTALDPGKLGALLLSIASVLGAAFGVNRSDIFRNGNGANGGGKVPPPPAVLAFPSPPPPPLYPVPPRPSNS
jgi:hypothetical protein